MFPAAVRRLWAATGCEIKVLWVNFKSPVTPCCAINAPDQLSACEWVIFFLNLLFFFYLLSFCFLFFFVGVACSLPLQLATNEEVKCDWTIIAK